MITVLFSVAVLGGCFALISLRILSVKDGTFRGGRCGKDFGAEDGACHLCPDAASCPEESRHDHEPKSSNAMFSCGTPKSSNIRRQDCNIAGGPHK